MSGKLVRAGLWASLLIVGFAVCATEPRAQTVGTADQQTIVLWPEGAPGAKGQGAEDTPTLTPYWPPKEKRTGAAVIVCPGGGYGRLAEHEGRPVAEWLNTLGVTAFVLKYRLGPRYNHPAPLLGRGARHPHVARTRRRVGSRPRARRHPRLLRRGPRRLDRRHALRRGPPRTPPTRSNASARAPTC